VDYAHTLKDLSDSHFPDARKIILVQDNLNTHKPASLYEAFSAGRRIETPTTPRPIGSSPHPKHVSDSSIYTRQSD
jgi:hypothetical protein